MESNSSRTRDFENQAFIVMTLDLLYLELEKRGKVSLVSSGQDRARNTVGTVGDCQYDGEPRETDCASPPDSGTRQRQDFLCTSYTASARRLDNELVRKGGTTRNTRYTRNNSTTPIVSYWPSLPSLISQQALQTTCSVSKLTKLSKLLQLKCSRIINMSMISWCPCL